MCKLEVKFKMDKKTEDFIAGRLDTQKRLETLADKLSKTPPFEGHALVEEFRTLIEEDSKAIKRFMAQSKK